MELSVGPCIKSSMESSLDSKRLKTDDMLKMYTYIDQIFETYYDDLWISSYDEDEYDSTIKAWSLFNLEPDFVMFIAQEKYGVNRIINKVHLLEMAVRYSNVTVFEKLLQLGIDPNAQYSMGNCFSEDVTILSWLVEDQVLCRKYLAKIKLLLKYGANPNIKDNIGYPLLHNVIFDNNIEGVKLLVDYGANCFLKNDCNENALNLAIKEDKMEIIKILYDHKLKLQKSVILLILARKGDENSLCGEYYLPLDLLKIFIKFMVFGIHTEYKNNNESILQ